jgi:hypothetical protein
MRQAWVTGILLTGCLAVPPAGTPVIEISSGSFYGSSATQVFATDILVTTFSKGAGRPDQQNVQQAAAGTYDRVAAVLAAKGPAAKAAIVPHDLQCLDYGTDVVRAEPPVAGIAQIVTACPDDAMAALTSALLAAIAPPG